jgi:hypothetical protein
MGSKFNKPNFKALLQLINNLVQHSDFSNNTSGEYKLTENARKCLDCDEFYKHALGDEDLLDQVG